MTTTWAGVVFVVSLALAIAVVYRLFADYLARVLTSDRHLRAERLVYRAVGIDPDAEQTWGRYLRSVLAFSAVSVIFLYAFLRLQHDFGHPYAPSWRSWRFWR
jgi:potassium-transporting ATPase potassium-binding subunit